MAGNAYSCHLRTCLSLTFPSLPAMALYRPFPSKTCYPVSPPALTYLPRRTIFESILPHLPHRLDIFVPQNNLLVRNQSQRMPVSSRDGVESPPSETTFFFAPSDRDRVLVVDLGKTRSVLESGVELFPTPGVSFSEAVGR